MRAHELIGQEVFDVDGEPIGVITDLRCIQDGPLRGTMALLRIDSLLVSRRHTGALLGYDRHEQQGPWLIRAIVRRLHSKMIVIEWSQVANHSGPIRLAGKAPT
jgi:sporulation protein YlmC with PRC-barrel domain